MAAKARLRHLVAEHAPVFYLHKAESNMPCTVEFFLQNSELWLRPPGQAERMLLPKGAITPAALMLAQQAHDAASLQMRLDPNARTGFPKDRINDVPLYCVAKEVMAPDGTVEALEINYLTLFAYNGSYNVLCREVGAHDGDWEHCTVRLDAETGRLQGVWYNAHRSRDGTWALPQQVPRTDGRIAAYIAVNGHGNYPRVGTITRAFLFANDHTSADGPVWRPSRCVLLPAALVQAARVGKGAPPPSDEYLLAVPSRGWAFAVAAALGQAEAAADAPLLASVDASQPDVQVLPPPQEGAVPLSPTEGHTPPTLVVAAIPSSAQASTTDLSRAAGAIAERRSDIDESERGAQATDGESPAVAAPADRPAAVPSPEPEPAQEAQGDDLDSEGRAERERAAPLHLHGGHLTADSSPHDESQAHTADPVQVVDDSQAAQWLAFQGAWGTIPAPIMQTWVMTAETPVSRSAFLRTFVQCWPETQSL